MSVYEVQVIIYTTDQGPFKADITRVDYSSLRESYKPAELGGKSPEELAVLAVALVARNTTVILNNNDWLFFKTPEGKARIIHTHEVDYIEVEEVTYG